MSALLNNKKIRLVPTLPAYPSKNTVKLLIDNIDIEGIKTVDKDIRKFVESKVEETF